MSDFATNSGSTYRPFPVFALIWAITTLAHQLAFTFWAESWQGWLLVAAAVAVIFRSGCSIRFLILVITSLLNLWNKLPFVPNHILWEGMLHIVMLAGAASFFLRGKGGAEWKAVSGTWKKGLLLFFVAALLKAVFFLIPDLPQTYHYVFGALTTLFLLIAFGRLITKGKSMGGGEDFLSRFAPVMRISVVMMYVWAVIQKLNRDYFDPEVTCAGKLHIEINAYFGNILPTADWALVGAAVGSLVFELGIPILLCFRTTRFAGFITAVGFHLWLSIHPAAGIFSFTSLILAVLVLFLPNSWGVEMQKIWDKQLRKLGGGEITKGQKRARWMVTIVFFVTLLTQGLLYLLIERSYEVFHTANRIGFFAFFIWGIWIGVCYLLAGKRAKGEGDQPLPNKFRPSWVLLALIPTLINGTLPWIGARTQTSFSMYSNLRSEAEGNHIFLKRVDLFQFQTDIVEVMESSPNILAPSKKPRGIQQFANIGHRIIPWFEFRRLVSEMEGDFEVAYRRGGKEMTLGRKEEQITGDAEAFRPLPLLQRKFLWFRRLETLEGPMCCTH